MDKAIKTKEFDTPLANIIFYEDKGYMKQLFFSQKVDDLDKYKEHLATIERELKDHLPLPTLADITQAKSAGKSVRDYGSKEGIKQSKGLVLLVKSAFARMLGNIVVRMISSEYPVRLFTNEEKGLEWLVREKNK